MRDEPNDYNCPWKEEVQRFFRSLLQLLCPSLYRLIDGSRGYEFLDKEPPRITRDARTGRRYVEILVKVWLKSGLETWILLHPGFSDA
jgi:hypothetical protein